MTDNHKPDNRTHAQKRQAERREAMRDFLVAKGYLEQIDADLGRELTQDELPAIKFKTETRLKLLNKILPDVGSNEVTVDTGESLTSLLLTLGKPNRAAENNP